MRRAELLLHPIGGTAFTGSKSVGYGTVVNVTATANTGYTFTGFTTSAPSMTPDTSGNVTIIGDVILTANFTSTVSDYHTGLLGEYYDVSELTNPTALKMSRIDDNVNFNFGFESPDASIDQNTYSIRWTGYIRPTVSGSYTFKTLSDDGVRLTVDGKQLIDNWGALSLSYSIADQTVDLVGGQY